MSKVTVNAADTIKKLGLLAQRIRSPKPALKRIGAYVRELSMQAFRDSEDPTTHQAWKTLSKQTIANRRRGPNPGKIKILVDTGELRSSIHSILIGKQAVAVGTNLKDKSRHQKGEGVPKRPFLGIDDPGLKEITRIMRKYLETGR